MFLNHIQLLSQRMLHDEIYDDPNDTVMYNNLKKTYTDADNCVEQIVNSIYKNIIIHLAIPKNYTLSCTYKTCSMIDQKTIKLKINLLFDKLRMVDFSQ